MARVERTLLSAEPHYLKKQDDTLAQLDLFAAYVIPVEAWYIISAALLFGRERKTGIMLYLVEPVKKDRYSYEVYKEAWPSLKQKPPRVSRTHSSTRKERTLKRLPLEVLKGRGFSRAATFRCRGAALQRRVRRTTKGRGTTLLVPKTLTQQNMALVCNETPAAKGRHILARTSRVSREKWN